MKLNPVQEAMQEITQHIENYNKILDLNKVQQILKIECFLINRSSKMKFVYSIYSNQK
jgi:ABC-type sulfate transport system permease component